MKQVDRERIHAALMGDVPGDFPALCKDLEELCSEEVRRIEPIIDEIVDRERQDAWKNGFMLAAPPAEKVTH